VTSPTHPTEVTEIARWVLGISGVTILLVSLAVLIGAAMTGADKFESASTTVFNALLPLLGTWVGTVLAYYFSRKNFETASQSVERMVTTLTTEQKLAQIFVEKEMLRSGQITLYRITAGKTAKDVPLKELLGKLGPGVTRIPVVDSTGVVQYIVHQSGLYKFVADKALAGKSQVDIDKLTLQDLVDDVELKNWVVNIVYVPETASVSFAKATMEAQKGCQDLIVTKTGAKNEPMLGWMTNIQIASLSKA
jgi:hypothetical protein